MKHHQLAHCNLAIIDVSEMGYLYNGYGLAKLQNETNFWIFLDYYTFNFCTFMFMRCQLFIVRLALCAYVCYIFVSIRLIKVLYGCFRALRRLLIVKSSKR